MIVKILAYPSEHGGAITMGQDRIPKSDLV